MSYGFELLDQNGNTIETSDGLSVITDIRTVTRGGATSGNFTVPASSHVYAVSKVRGQVPIQVSLSGGTTVNWSVPSSSYYFPLNCAEDNEVVCLL